MKKRLLSLALSFVMLLTMLPVSVWAEEDEATAVTTVTTEFVESVTNVGQADNDELLMGYLYQAAVTPQEALPYQPLNTAPSSDYIVVSHRAAMGAVPSNDLTETERRVYTALQEAVAKIAKGDEASSIIEINLEDATYTAEDIGATNFGDKADQDLAFSRYSQEQVPDVSKLITVLMAETPFELYWYDKEMGARASTSLWMSGSTTSTTVGGKMVIYMSVAQEYATGGGVVLNTESGEETILTEVKSSTIDVVNTAINKAHIIVESYIDQSNYSKLKGYLDEVMGLTAYNEDAAKPATKPPYGNPWQLIWVFDGDPNTNVVCEGYAKAFKYLCDLTEWNDTSFSCILATGQMTGGTGEGPHMWNIVHIRDANNPNGASFLVDPTNCDEGMVGGNYGLFLKGNSTSEDVVRTNENTGNSYNSLTYTFTFGSQSINFGYDEETQALYDIDELTLAAQDYEEPAAQPELVWQGGFLSENGFVTESESRGQMEVSVFDEFSGRLVYVDADNNATVLSRDDVTFPDGDKLQVTVDEENGGILRLKALAEGDVTLTYGDVSFVLHIHLPPVAFYADQAAETLLDILDYNGTNGTVYLAVKDSAVSITAVERGEGVQDVTKLNDTLYSVTIGTLTSASITVLVSGTMGDITAEQAPISLPVNDLRPGLVWHWLDWRDGSWQENGTNRYWDDRLGNEPIGYITYRDNDDNEQRLDDDALSQLTIKGVQFALEKEEGESHSRVHLLFDSLGVATIAQKEGQPLKICVDKPEIGLSTDAAGENPMAMWVLDGTNDKVYIYWPEDVVVREITREDGNSNVTEITMDDSGHYARVTLKEVGEDWLNFGVRAARRDHPEDEHTYWVGIRLLDRRPGLRFFWVDYDWENERVNDVREDEPQSRMVMSPDETWIVQLAYYDGEKYHAVSQDYTLPDGLLRLERTVDGQYLALTARDFGSGDITYTVGDTTYSLSVSVTLPKVGFYKRPGATEENFLQSWSYTGENDIFYLRWPENATLQSLTFDENSRTAIQVVNESTKITDGFAKIKVLSYVDDWIGVDVRFRYEGQDHDDSHYARLHLENNAPGLSFLWVDGDWNRDDTFTIREDQDPQSQLNMAVNGNAFIQLNFHDGQGNSQPVTDLDNVTVSGAVSREKTVQGKYLVLRPENFGSGTITYTVNGKTYTLPVVVELPELGFYDTFDDLPQEGSEGWEAQWQEHYVTRWNFKDKSSVVYLVPLHGGHIQAVKRHDGNEMDWRGTVGDNGAYASFQLNSFSGAGDLGARVTFIRDGAQDNDTWDLWLAVADGRENPLSATADMACDYDKENEIYWVRNLPLGGDVTLQAKVEGSSEGCTYQWFENGFDPERGHYSEPIEGATGLNLTVKDLQRNRGFTLRVTRKVDDTYSEICNVIFELCIKNDLHFAVTTEAAATYYGGTVDVAATMTAGEGAVTDGLFYEWYLEDTFFRGPDREMTLDGVTRGGTYRLQVWDCYGNLFDAEGQVEITVLPAQPGRVYLAHTNRDYGNGDVLEIYQGDTIHLGVSANGYTREGLAEGDSWICTWSPDELEKLRFHFYGAEDEFGEEFTWKDDLESPYGPYVDTRNVQPGDYELTFGYQLMSQLNNAENAKSYDPFTITIRVKAPEAKTVWDGQEYADGGVLYVRPGQTGINPVADFQLDLINDFAVVAWDPQTLREVGFTVGDEPLWVLYQGENTAVPNISVPENLAPGTKATLTWSIVRGSTSPVANGENKWEDAETVYTYTVTIAIPERGNVNGAVNALGKAVDASDMQCLFEYLSLGQINSRLVKDDNDPAQVAYFRTVADVNEDGLVNILDYQALYEMVKAQ